VTIEGPPGPAEIRRALAECMTLANVDEALGWEPGTAGRLRWTAGPDRLPPPDAELGGVALWFRSTIAAWQEAELEDDEPEDAEPGDDEDEELEDEPDEEPEEEPEDDEPEPRLQSGFELAPGQRVRADIHGRWRDAVVTHRDRFTVAVDYNLDDTPHGARRQRISIDRVRLPESDET
jgi:hypothetical protein